VETAVTGGLGFRSTYYPYLPVDEIRQRLRSIRRLRGSATPSERFFLMVGSCAHGTTRASFEWFIDNVRARGLPDGVRVVVTGSRTEQLLRGAAPIDGIELRGWIDQEELDRLLVQATAVLVPQLFGFGALTRLPELACAGIPVIASIHPTLAIDPPPGLVAVEDEWQAWRLQIERLAGERRDPAADEYDAWERRQASPLREYVSRLASGGAVRPAHDEGMPTATQRWG
jgi:glycosyltransferase involved in cell wall biosynthesis